jgi:hypothetical protein
MAVIIPMLKEWVGPKSEERREETMAFKLPFLIRCSKEVTLKVL